MGHVNRRFMRHYAEMVLVMFVGMAVLGLPAGWGLQAVGSGWAELSPPAMLALMAFTMTAPMVWWMWRMGHAWQPNAEMALSMIVPAIGAIGLYAAGLVEDGGALMVIEHVVMLIAMFGVMLLRPEEYSGAHCHGTATA